MPTDGQPFWPALTASSPMATRRWSAQRLSALREDHRIRQLLDRLRQGRGGCEVRRAVRPAHQHQVVGPAGRPTLSELAGGGGHIQNHQGAAHHAADLPQNRCGHPRSHLLLWMVVRIRAKMAQRKKLAWPLRSSQLLLAVERLVANDGWVTSRVKAVSRRRRGPQARLYRACHPAILDHRGRRLTPATLLPPPSMRGFTPPVTAAASLQCC